MLRAASTITTVFQQQHQSNNATKSSMRVLGQQLYSRLVFYGRFMNAALSFGSTEVSSREKIQRKRGRRAGTPQSRATARIFAPLYNGVRMIYWKSLLYAQTRLISLFSKNFLSFKLRGFDCARAKLAWLLVSMLFSQNKPIQLLKRQIKAPVP